MLVFQAYCFVKSTKIIVTQNWPIFSVPETKYCPRKSLVSFQLKFPTPDQRITANHVFLELILVSPTAFAHLRCWLANWSHRGHTRGEIGRRFWISMPRSPWKKVLGRNSEVLATHLTFDVNKSKKHKLSGNKCHPRGRSECMVRFSMECRPRRVLVSI